MSVRKVFFAAVMATGMSVFATNATCLIQPDSVGAVHAGMTIAQARQALNGAILKASEDADRLPIYTVTQNRLHTMDLYVGADGPQNDRSKVELIRVYDGACSTREGVRPGMPLYEVSQRYGRVTRVRVTDTESREYAEFERQPPWLEIQIGNGQVGIYPPGKRCSMKFESSAHIASLWVSHPVEHKLPEDSATCDVPPGKR